jgi:hypothetical protein
MEMPDRAWTFIAGIAVGGIVFGAGYLAGHGAPKLPSHWTDDRQEDRPDPQRSNAPAPVAREPRVEQKVGGVFGTATIEGTVSLHGTPPEMKVPRKRRDAEVCKDKPVKYNAVVTRDGELQDVLVKLSDDAVKGEYEPPVRHAEIDQIDCMYVPRVLGVVAGQELDIKNGDRTLHNVHTYKGAETWFNQAQPKESAPIVREVPDEPRLIKVTCDVHPWMRGFVVVSPHPFFAVSGPLGEFTIKRVPAGKFTVEAWHPHYGLKTQRVKVEEGGHLQLYFAYDGNEPEPAENRDELKDLF